MIRQNAQHCREVRCEEENQIAIFDFVAQTKTTHTILSVLGKRNDEKTDQKWDNRDIFWNCFLDGFG